MLVVDHVFARWNRGDSRVKVGTLMRGVLEAGENDDDDVVLGNRCDVGHDVDCGSSVESRVYIYIYIY